MAAAATTYTASLAPATVSGAAVSTTVTIKSPQTVTVAQAGVCSRVSTGGNKDFPADAQVVLNATGRTVTHVRSFAAGTYTYWACLRETSGRWINVGAVKSFTVGSQALTGDRCGLAIPGTHLAFEDTQTQLDEEMELVAETGCRWIRFDVAAVQVEPTQGVRYWGNIDRVVASATKHGLKIAGAISTLPAWTASSWQAGATTAAQRSAFAAFATAAAARYFSQIQLWGVWNEPNNPAFWTNPSVAQYTALLKVTYPAIKAGNPHATVLLGGTAGGQPGPNDTASWYKGLYLAGGKNYFNAANIHPYPASPTNPVSGEQALTGTILTIMSANGDAAKLLWGTESGFPTGGSNSTTEAGQATLLMGLYNHWASAGGSRVGPMFTYTLRDLPGAADREQWFGIVRNDFTKKPAFAALVARNRT